MAIRMAMIAITTSNSISVKPLRRGSALMTGSSKVDSRRTIKNQDALHEHRENGSIPAASRGQNASHHAKVQIWQDHTASTSESPYHVVFPDESSIEIETSRIFPERTSPPGHQPFSNRDFVRRRNLPRKLL